MMMSRAIRLRQRLTVRSVWGVVLPFLLFLSVHAAEAQELPTVLVEPVADAGVRGTAALEPADDLVQVAVDLEGLQPGVEYQVRLYAGTPEAPSASFGLLGALTADETGRARLQASQMLGTGTGHTVAVTRDLLADGDHFIAIFEPGAGTLATGAVPPSAPPAPDPPASSVPQINEVLDAVASHDPQRVLPLVQMTELACGPATPEGFNLVPACGPGEPDGTPGRVLPAASCESYWARDPGPVLQSFVDHVGTLHAVVRSPQAGSVDSPSLWPPFDYLVIYAPRPDSYMRGLGLFVRDGSIVAVEAGCNTPEQLMHWAGNDSLEVVLAPASVVP
jgi:hypothetical protein